MNNIAQATTKYIRMSPRKVQLVADSIRGKNYIQALKILKNSKKIASGPLWKTLYSAGSNAQYRHNIEKEELIVNEIFVNKGPTLKRGRPRAQGRIFKILKRTSHVTIKLTQSN